MQFIIFLAFFSLALVSGVYAEDAGQSARGAFISLPTSIFDTLSDGLSEDEKEKLILNGFSDSWGIEEESVDNLVFASEPNQESRIGLRIFHDNKKGGALAAFGSLDEPICVLELWTIAPSGKILPADTPEEPAITDFFKKGHKIAKAVSYSVMMCLEDDGLAARPIFWDKKGMRKTRPDNRINYYWNGSRFEKKIVSQ